MDHPSPSPEPGHRLAAAGAILTIDLAAIAANWRILRDRVAPAACGAVVKADAYGLGAIPVARALYAAGCRFFFVAHLEEAIALRPHLPDAASLFVMHGVFPGLEADCVAHGILPVLNSPAQLDRYRACAIDLGQRLPAALQVDTGMTRFGFPPEALPDPAALAPLRLELLMSHLACADDPDHPANEAQRASFGEVRRLLPGAPASLAASSGIFLGPQFHYDLVRPGAALYGVAPQEGRANPMQPVVRLEAKIVQCRTVPGGTSIGYGHTARTAAPARLATIAVGYADGFLRSASNRGWAEFQGVALPILGRVSMDSIVLDVSALPEGTLAETDLVTLIGGSRTLDALAAAAGTIGYEILTALGARYHRHYLPAPALEAPEP